MTTTVTLDASTAEQSMLAYAMQKWYRPTLWERIDDEIVQLPNPETPLQFISKIKQQEMVDDMLQLTVKRLEAQSRAEIEATQTALLQAVSVDIQ